MVSTGLGGSPGFMSCADLAQSNERRQRTPKEVTCDDDVMDLVRASAIRAARAKRYHEENGMSSL